MKINEDLLKIISSDIICPFCNLELLCVGQGFCTHYCRSCTKYDVSLYCFNYGDKMSEDVIDTLFFKTHEFYIYFRFDLKESHYYEYTMTQPHQPKLTIKKIPDPLNLNSIMSLIKFIKTFE